MTQTTESRLEQIENILSDLRKGKDEVRIFRDPETGLWIATYGDFVVQGESPIQALESLSRTIKAQEVLDGQ